MQAISGSVGDKGANNISDVALVQAILLKTQRAATPGSPAGPYLASYDGVCGDGTKAAIRAFQTDHVFVSADGRQCAPNPNATSGLVAPGDATWKKLIEKVGAGFADMRVLAGGKTVYVAATDAQLLTKIAAANAMTFTPAFRTKVIACINRMHALHGIAIGVCRQGDRRDFQTQYDLLTSGRGVTNAGPGESNHNFGMAVDLGFEGLRWLQSNGTVTENETSWLHRLDPRQTVVAEALRFWDALRAVGTSAVVGAFRGPAADRPHLQNWSDAGVSMAARLADLLTRSGTMRWAATRGAYTCDLGLGGDLVSVGTAAQIWNRQATLTLAELTRLRGDQAARAAGAQRAGPGGAGGAPPGRPPVPAQPPRPGAPMPGGNQPGAPAQPVTQADVTAMQRELRHQFELADANWQAWTSR